MKFWEALQRKMGCYECQYAEKALLGVGPCCNGDPNVCPWTGEEVPRR